jgi:hypothetical protein
LSNCTRPDARRRALLAFGAAWALPAASAPARVEPFDAGTWAALQREVNGRRKPMLVVFSATWCAVCPDVIERLAGDTRRTRAGVPLLVVLADVAPGEADARLLASAHYRRADRLLAFDGPNAAIRHAVDPQWRGVSPAVAWLAPGERRQFVQGAPASADLQRWYATALPNPAAPHPNAGPGAPPRNRLP